MNKITNTTQINEFVQQIQPMKDKLDTINEQMNNYLKFMKNNNIEKKENESKEDALRRSESTLDRIKEIVLSIGKLDIKAELAQLDTYIEETKSLLDSAKQDKQKICPLIIKLSLLFGLTLAIVLI